MKVGNLLISLQNNIAFLAMTKTGSTAIETALAPNCDVVMSRDPKVKHMQLRRFDKFLRPYLDSIGCKSVETTCLFREPLKWLGSWYRYRSRPEIFGTPNSTAGISFETFIRAYLAEDPPPYARVGRPSRFVTRSDDKVGIDHLFRYEEFGQFAAFLNTRFGTRFSFGIVNVSPEGDMYLPKAVLQECQENMRRDYDIYESLRT